MGASLHTVEPPCSHVSSSSELPHSGYTRARRRRAARLTCFAAYMGALLSHHVGRALGNAGADHHGATIHPGDDPPGVPEGCVDELGWTNRWGDTCVRLHDRCRDGAFIHGHIHEFTTGEPYNYPERACCACGGGAPPTAAPAAKAKAARRVEPPAGFEAARGHGRR